MKKFISIILSATVLTLTLTANASFTDIEPKAWYYDAINYVCEQSLFNGTSKNTFSPNTNMTRAMFVTVLSNFTKTDLSDFDEQHFLDVPTNQWYSKQVEWAVRNSIVSGTRKFMFSPNKDITREEMATMLYRFAQQTGNDTSFDANVLKKYTDSDKISTWAKEPMAWTVSHGIINGTSSKNLSPKQPATRAQAAQIFKNCDVILTHKILNNTPIEPDMPDEIDKIIYSMSLEEKVGQMFLARYPSNPDVQTKTYHPAGYTLYAKDFTNKSKTDVKNMISYTQNASKIPLLIAVDEEGGTVVRVSSNPQLRNKPFDSPQNIYKKAGMDGIIKDTKEKSNLLLDLGINLNLAPVCDVTNDTNAYIYERTLGLNAQETAKVIEQIVKTMNEQNMSGTLKHFPGYGNNLDTHTGISIDNRPLSELQANDLIPFQAGIDSDVPGVLISHNIIASLDPNRPASMSKTVIDYLRTEMDFDGIVMTDDIGMDAIKLYAENPVIQAIKAGNDLILTSDLPNDFDTLLRAVKNGTIPESRLNESIKRTLSWKLSKDIMQN